MAIKPISHEQKATRHAEAPLNPRQQSVPQPRQSQRSSRLPGEQAAVHSFSPLQAPPKIGPTAVSKRPNVLERPGFIKATEQAAQPRIPIRQAGARAAVQAPPTPRQGRNAAPVAHEPNRAALKRTGIPERREVIHTTAIRTTSAPKTAKAIVPATRAEGHKIDAPRTTPTASPRFRSLAAAPAPARRSAVATAPRRLDQEQEQVKRRALVEAIRRAPQQAARRAAAVDQIA